MSLYFNARWLSVLLTCLALLSVDAAAQRPSAEARPAADRPVFAIDSTAHAGAASRILAMPDERQLVTVSHDKTLRIWDVESGQLVRRFVMPVRESVDGEIMALALSPDGRFAAVGGYLRAFGEQKAVVIVSLADGSVRQTLKGFSSVIWALSWSPDGRFLAIGLGDDGGGDKNGVRIFETARWQPIFGDVSAEGRTASLGFRSDNTLFATTHNPPRSGSIRLFKPQGNGFVRSAVKSYGGKGGHRAYWSRDEQFVYVQGHGYYDGDNLLEPRHPTQGKRNQGGGKHFLGMRESPDGRFLYAMTNEQHAKNGAVWRWSTPVSGAYREFEIPDPRPTDFVILKNGYLAYVTDNGVVAALGPDMMPLWRNERRVAAIVNEPARLRVSSDGNWVSLPVDHDGRRADLAFNLVEPRFSTPEKLSVSWNAPDTGRTSMRILSWEGTREPSINNVRFPMKKERERSLSVALHASEDAFVFGTTGFYLRKSNARGEALWSRYLQANVSAVNIIESRNLVVAATSDGFLHLLRWSDGKPVLRYYLEPGDRKWIALSNLGYYEAGIGAEDIAGWIVNRRLDHTADFFPLSRFRNRFLLPGLSRAALATVANDDAVKALLDARQKAGAGDQTSGGNTSLAESVVAQEEAERQAEVARVQLAQQAEAAMKAHESLLLAAKQAAAEQVAADAKHRAQLLETARLEAERKQRVAAEQARQAEAARLALDLQRQEEERIALLAMQQAEEQRLAEQAKQAEEARKIALAKLEEQQQAEHEWQKQLAAAAAEVERLNVLAAAALLAQTVPQVAPSLQQLPPVVDVLSGFDVAVSQKTLVVRYRVNTPEGAPVTQVRGRVIAGSQVARALLVAMPTAKDEEIRFELPDEDSQIQIVAENRWGASVPATIRVRWQGQKSTGGRSKGVLHVVAVGVSEYDNPDYRLGFAAKDARDFAHEIDKQGGGFYSAVKLHLLTDQAAAKSGIETAFADLRGQVAPKDTTMVFLAGHGINDASGEYLYLPREANLSRLKETGVSFRKLGDLLASLPGRTVMFVDTCHSGNVVSRLTGGQSQNNAAAVNELASSEKNIIVFASSTGDQASLEHDAWGNGAFTKALLEGFGGKADLLKRGRVTYKQLDAYVADRVDELTDGKQTPVTPVLVTVPDFTLTEVRK